MPHSTERSAFVPLFLGELLDVSNVDPGAERVTLAWNPDTSLWEPDSTSNDRVIVDTLDTFTTVGDSSLVAVDFDEVIEQLGTSVTWASATPSIVTVNESGCYSVRYLANWEAGASAGALTSALKALALSRTLSAMTTTRTATINNYHSGGATWHFEAGETFSLYLQQSTGEAVDVAASLSLKRIAC